ncbi:hypothetical protein LXL04_023729 [Taraxacum kok-saghyz]
MKSSLGKLGRKLSLQKSDVKETRDHQPSAHIDEIAQASKDMQDMRNCYDGLLSAAAATANSIYEFSESLNEMGSCLLGKTGADADGESGKMLSTLADMQLELQKIADTYRSDVVVTITNPSESLLSELRKVEEMKLQCDEKREVYEYMMTQQREKGKLRNGKVDQKLKEAQEEFDEAARLCVFRVKSLKEGQCRSLLTQAARHHAAQVNFFRKGLKVLEAVEPSIRNVAEKHRIDYQISGLYDEGGEPMSGYESTDDGELSFDYNKQKKHVLDDDDGSSPNPMECFVFQLDQVDFPNLEDSEINRNKQVFGRQPRVSSYSAPLFPDKIDTSEKPKGSQPPRKFYSYVLPPPTIDTRNPNSRPPSNSIPFQPPIPSDTDSNSNSATQLPAPIKSDDKVAQRQSYSGPLPPSRQFSFNIASTSGPTTTSELPQPPSRIPVAAQPSRSASPPPISSPKISELHELPRPPTNLPFSKSGANNNVSRHSAPLYSKNQESLPPNKRAMLSSISASPLPLPPLVVPRSFSIPSKGNDLC